MNGLSAMIELVANLRVDNARLRETAKLALAHVRDLEDAWRSGALNERDGKGGTRSNRNLEVRRSLEIALKEPTP